MDQGDQVELPLLALGRGQEQLLVQPVDVGELEPFRPGGVEAAEEGLEELLEKHLEALVVIRTGGLRHARPPLETGPRRAGRTDRTRARRGRVETPCYQEDRS